MNKRHATRPHYPQSMRQAKQLSFAGLVALTLIIGMMIGASLTYGIMADTCHVETQHD